MDDVLLYKYDFQGHKVSLFIMMAFMICIIGVIILYCFKRKRKYYDWAQYLVLLFFPLVVLLLLFVFVVDANQSKATYDNQEYITAEGTGELIELKKDRTDNIWFLFSVGEIKIYSNEIDILNVLLSLDSETTLQIHYMIDDTFPRGSTEIYPSGEGIFILEIVQKEND